MARAQITCYAVSMKKAFFIGIGGIGMSALACIMLSKGWEVSGSDQNTSEITGDLEKRGIKVFIGHDQDNVDARTDLVVYSEAIPSDNTERQKAGYHAIESITYAQALARIANEHKLVLITGTHGKTTTTGMLTKIALENNLDPTIVIGGKMKELNNTNFRTGESDLWIVEGCEYRRSFLNFQPDILVVTNVDVDHLDYYQTADNYLEAFVEMIEKVKPGGTVIFNEEDERSKKAVEMAKNKSSLNLKYYPASKIEDICQQKGINLHVPGLHNRSNGIAALLGAEAIGIEEQGAVGGLNKFSGTWRRLEYLGQLNNSKVYDDYAHHPVEIKATLQGLRELYPKEKICCVFQPHQFNRTKHFISEFAESFQLADKVIIPNIYKVRDTESDLTLTDADLITEISAKHSDVVSGGGLEQTKELINKHAQEWDVIVLMGAGDIVKLREIAQI